MISKLTPRFNRKREKGITLAVVEQCQNRRFKKTSLHTDSLG